MDSVTPSGAVRGHCESRVLESALLLALLRRTRTTPQAARHLEQFLSARTTGGDRIDDVLARAATGNLRREDDVKIRALVDEAPEFMRTRKHALIAATLCLLGRPQPHVAPPPIPAQGMHPAGRVQLIAIRVILAHAAGRPAPAAAHELLPATSAPRVWEGNLLVHLLAANALSLLPGHEAAVAGGIRQALACRRPDGGVPFVTGVDTWCTVTAGIALASCGAPTAVQHRLARHLAAQQRADGGWSYTDHAHHTDTDDTAVAVEFLHTLDPTRYRTPIDRGLAHLRSLQGPDGGFPTYVAGARSEAGMTAAAVNALSIRPSQHRPHIHAALDFLTRAQRPDALFPPEWSRSRFHVAFRALLAADAPYQRPAPHGTDRRMVRTLLTAVLHHRNSDGGWGQQPGECSDAISTAYALLCLCRHHAPRPAIEAATFLLDTQRDDGSIASRPDMLGTRPFLYNVPRLADHFALLALGHLHQRLHGT
ncbi:prenyltransferase/squalene oxidase repeat-containing protein [Streptomyces tsukubensis]|nr:prenyltransferase/squalene oxidase repeat-containing protein [Streptomyces tsukubensis]